jgi:hypothetical protein
VSPLPEETWVGVNEHVLSGGRPAVAQDRARLPGNTLPLPSGTASRLKLAVWPAAMVCAAELLLSAKSKPITSATPVE